MKLMVVPTGGGPFEIVVEATAEITHVKDAIEAVLGPPLWRASHMDLLYRQRTLLNGSTLLQNNIEELDTIYAIQAQGPPAMPALNEEILPSHQPPTDGSMMSLDFNFDNFPDIPGGPILEADAPIGEKLILPENFQENTVLNQLRTHHFRTAGQLRDKINNNPPVWLSKFEAYAILANPHVFCAHDIDDFVDRNNGTVVLVKSIEYANFLSQGRGYKLESPMTISIEKYSGQFKISGEVTLDRHEIVGDLWTRRRIQLTGDNNFSLIQWITTSRKKKDSVKSDVSNLVKVVGEMRTQLSFVATDVTNINARVTEIHNNMQQRDDINSSLSSAVTQLSASVVALLGRVPQEQPTDPNTSG